MPFHTARELVAAWAARDTRYSMRRDKGIRSPLSESEQGAIIAFRLEEALALPGRHNGLALSELSRWSPPAVMA